MPITARMMLGLVPVILYLAYPSCIHGQRFFMSNRRFAISVLVMLFGSLFAACGGGGGNSNTPTPPPTATPPQPPPRLSLEFIPVNAPGAMQTAVTLTENAFQIASLAKSMVLELAAAERTVFSRNCRTGGVVEFDLTDLDGDLVPSPGDTLRVTFRDCETQDLNTSASGDLLIAMTMPSPSPVAGETAISGTVDATGLTIVSPHNPANTIRVDGNPSFSYRRDKFNTSLSISGDAVFSLSSGGTTTTETLSGFEFRKSQSFEEARYQIDVKCLFDSESLGGTFEFDDTLNLSGFFENYPERGRLELIGRDGSRVALTPILVSAGAGNSDVFIKLDEAGNGSFQNLSRPSWREVIQGFFWWFEESDDLTYGGRSYDPTSVFVSLYDPGFNESARPDTQLRLQYSRRMDPESIPNELFACVQGNEMVFDRFCAPLDIELHGALLLLTPRQQLPQNYRILSPYPSFYAFDELGNRTLTVRNIFNTTETVFAFADISSRSVISGETVSLDASQSSATAGSITGYRWSQISGPAITINNADSATASFVVPAVTQAEEVSLRLDVVNSEGIVDHELIPVAVFPSEQDIRLAIFTGEGSDFVTQGFDWVLTNTNGFFIPQQARRNELSITHENRDEDRIWQLHFAGPRNERLEVGLYENADRFPFHSEDGNGLDVSGDGRGCVDSTGSFEILDINYDSFGSLVSVAIDFDLFCEDVGVTRAHGSLRINSRTPVTLNR